MTAKTPDLVKPTTRPVDCILVQDETPESDEAERLLREAGIHFSVDPPGTWGKRSLELQTVEFGNLDGIGGVRAYIEQVRSQSLRRGGSAREHKSAESRSM